MAIKVFTGAADFKSLKREIDVVKSLPPHESIVKLFGVEEEVSDWRQLENTLMQSSTQAYTDHKHATCMGM